MTEIDRLVTDTSSLLRGTLLRLSGLARKLVIATLVISFATYATGLWVTDSNGWRVGGFVLCAAPVACALLAWWRLHKVAIVAPRAFDDLGRFLADQRTRSAVGLVIDYDSGQQIRPAALNMASMRKELTARQKEMPALYETVRAVMSVPGLAAIATAGIIGLGLLGTIMLVVGLLT